MREAQRTYQKRKDSAAASERRRCDDILQVISDLSTDIEALLQAASAAGTLNLEGDLAARLRRLWSSYDTAISSPCINPELRLLQVKNDRRKAEHISNLNRRRDTTPSVLVGLPEKQEEQRRTAEFMEADQSRMDLVLARVDETTLVQSFSTISANNKVMGGRSIFEVVRERQAEFESSRSPASL